MFFAGIKSLFLTSSSGIKIDATGQRLSSPCSAIAKLNMALLVLKLGLTKQHLNLFPQAITHHTRVRCPQIRESLAISDMSKADVEKVRQLIIYYKI